jgi:uncharacterized membrane protein YbhN (UPF0104 family)
MNYSDWLIISISLIMITFLTLLGLAVFETDLKNTSWFLWFSIGGLVLSIIAVAVLIWYYKGKGTNKKKELLTREEQNKLNMEKERINEKETKDDETTQVSKIFVNDLQNVR